MFTTSIVIFIYKRTSSFTRIAEVLRQVKAAKIYIIADGPKTGDESECNKARLYLEKQLDWPCEIVKYYSDKNLGLKKRLSSGISQVFVHEDNAIFIEDDCVPGEDFLYFANEMLKKYWNSPMIMSINGTSIGGDFNYSYDFAKYSQCWGWATWKRAWKLNDPDLKSFSKKSWAMTAKKIGLSKLQTWYWYTALSLVKEGWIDTWDYQWSYAHFIHQGLAIVPSVNLVSNTGFDAAATNTKTRNNAANIPLSRLTWPLSHPTRIIENKKISIVIEHNFYQNPVAILGLMRQYFYYLWRSRENRH